MSSHPAQRSPVPLPGPARDALLLLPHQPAPRHCSQRRLGQPRAASARRPPAPSRLRSPRSSASWPPRASIRAAPGFFSTASRSPQRSRCALPMSSSNPCELCAIREKKSSRPRTPSASLLKTAAPVPSATAARTSWKMTRPAKSRILHLAFCLINCRAARRIMTQPTAITIPRLIEMIATP